MTIYNTTFFKKTLIIGLGLIGASIAQAMRDKSLSGSIIACDANASSLKIACQEGLIDDGFVQLDELFECHRDVDLIILGVPVCVLDGLIPMLAQFKITQQIPSNTIITDVASTKNSVLTNIIHACRAVHRDTDFLQFVPSHPIAGAENSGVGARRGDLFVAQKFIICQESDIKTASVDNVDKIQKLWQTIGAEVIIMSAAHHDKILAHTSHLPHLLAFNLVAQLSAHNDNMDIFRYAAGGFRDFSRIAASDSTMWHDIFLANKAPLLEAIADYQVHLTHLKMLIEGDDSQQIKAILINACHARRHFGHMLKKQNKEKIIMNQQFILQPSQQFIGEFTVASDKSISHRSIMFGALADGVTHVRHFLEGEDALSTLNAFVEMGVKIERQGSNVTIYGVGVDGLCAPKNPLDMGNSGTSMRLLAGILSAQKFDSVMIGDVSLSGRPMERVAVPLRQMGAMMQTTGEKGTPPISIVGNQSLQAINYTLPMASAQVKSCLLLAGIWANGTTSITEPKISRDHSERMLEAFGYPIIKNDNTISITGGNRLTATDIDVPADISSAAFFMVAASIAKTGDTLLKHVGINPTRTGVIDILRLMGADITLMNERVVGGEPVVDIMVKSVQLQGIEIPLHLVSLAIDEFPVLFIAASCAVGKTLLRGAKELRVKESDRIAVMAQGLTALGIECTVLDDGIEIMGRGETEAIFGGGVIDAHHDHRIAMSFAVASLRAQDTIIINGTQTVNTSFPDFAKLIKSAGVDIVVVK